MLQERTPPHQVGAGIFLFSAFFHYFIFICISFILPMPHKFNGGGALSLLTFWRTAKRRLSSVDIAEHKRVKVILLRSRSALYP